MSRERIRVGVAEIAVAKEQVDVACDGVGSALAICAVDPVAGVTGVAHAPLPSSGESHAVADPGRYVDTAVAELVARMEAESAVRERIVVAYAGGSRFLRFSESAAAVALDFGEMNASAMEHAIAVNGLKCLAHEVGGTQVRDLVVDAATGEVRCRDRTGEERTLCRLNP